MIGEGKEAKKESISIQHPRWVDLAHLLLFSYKSITYGRPQATINLPADVLDSFMPPGLSLCPLLPIDGVLTFAPPLPPACCAPRSFSAACAEPDIQDGLLATYLAKCNHVDIPQRMRVLDYLMTCFQTEDKTFELSAVFDFLKEPSAPDVTALTGALLYTGWFNEVVANDFKLLGNAGLQALAPLFGVPSPITKAVFVNINASESSRVAGQREAERGNEGRGYEGFRGRGKDRDALCKRRWAHSRTVMPSAHEWRGCNSTLNRTH